MKCKFENHHEKAKYKRALSLYRQQMAEYRILKQTVADWFWGHNTIRNAGHREWDPQRYGFVLVSKSYLKLRCNGTWKLLKSQTNRRYRRGNRLADIRGKNALYKCAFDDMNVY